MSAVTNAVNNRLVPPMYSQDDTHQLLLLHVEVVVLIIINNQTAFCQPQYMWRLSSAKY